MRTEFIPYSAYEGTDHTPTSLCPWSAVIIAVEGGWLAFESVSDHDTWQRQE